MARWTLEDIPWDRFDRAKVDPDLLCLIKAAALVEYNGGDYAAYLNRVFAGDRAFQTAADLWATEEVQHGEALARWAGMADPDFDFQAAFDEFRAGFQLPREAEASVRGSRAGELIARCIVEVGTNSYYTALSEAAEEPVIKEICRLIADDEAHHYKLFLGYLKRYQAHENLPAWTRFRVAAGRIAETDDDELAYAYYASNKPGPSYDRRLASREYARRAYPLYSARHVARGMDMIFRAIGLTPGRTSRVLGRLAHRFMQWRAAGFARQGEPAHAVPRLSLNG